MLLVLCLLVVRLVGQNLVINGDFSQTNVAEGGRLVSPEGILGWNAAKVEVGAGPIYNSRWPATFKVMSLDTGANEQVVQTINFPTAGQYKISFLFAAYENKADSSHGMVSIGSYSKIMRPWDNGIHTLQMIFDVLAGSQTIQFKGLGAQDCYGLTVTQIQVTQYNPIVNCDFQYPSLNGQVSVTFPNGILGWVTDRTVLQLGTFQNSNWEDDIVVLQTVDFRGGITYTQTLPTIPPNKQLTLSFSWAPTMDVKLASQSAKVVWNNNVIIPLLPKSNGVIISTTNVISSNTNSIVISGIQIDADSGIAVGKLRLVINS